MNLAKTTPDTEITLVARENVTRGHILEGSYQSLFDSNGKLNSSYNLTIGDLTNFISYFPNEAILGSAVASPTKPTPSTPEPKEEEIEYDPILEPSPTYTIRHDIAWIDLVGEGGSGLESGEDTLLITNISDVGFSVVWRSNQPESGYMKLGIIKTDLGTELRDIRDGLSSMNEYSSHLIESGRLNPDTTYYFEIYSGNTLYDNGGTKYSVRTLSTLSSPPPFETKTGSVINATDPSDLVLVFKIVDTDESETLGSSGYMSVLPDDTGDWVVTTGDARSEDGSSYYSYSTADILQAYFLGAKNNKFDFRMSEETIQLDFAEVSAGSNLGGVQLLTDYGIIIFE